MADRWFTDATRARVDWATAVTGGTARLDIYELVKRSDRADTTLLRFRWASNGQAVTAARVSGARAAESTAAVPTGTVYDAVPHARVARVVDNGDGTATYVPA